MRFFAGKYGLKLRFTVAATQRIQPDEPLLIFPAQSGDFSRLDFISGIPQKLQERVKIRGLLSKSCVYCYTQKLPVGGLCLIAQPFVVALSVPLRILHDGQPVLDAQRIVEPPHGSCAAPKVSELPGAVEGRGIPDDMIMDVVLVDVGADDESVVPVRKAFGKLTADVVRFLRRDLAGDKGLPKMIGNHIVRTARPAGESGILPFGKKKLGVRCPAVAFIAGDDITSILDRKIEVIKKRGTTDGASFHILLMFAV